MMTPPFLQSVKPFLRLDVYKAASTPEEMEKIQEALRKESEWLEEDSWGETFVVIS